MKKKLERITSSKLSKTLDIPLSTLERDWIDTQGFYYRDITPQERDEYISEVIDALFGDTLISGEHRINQWEEGWRENLLAFMETHNIESLIPKYHGKHRLVHWKQKMILPLKPYFDYHIHQYKVSHQSYQIY